MSSDLNEGPPSTICPLDGGPCEGQGTDADCNQCAIETCPADGKPCKSLKKDCVGLCHHFAFWSYASFPYVLGGTVTKMLADGRVSTVEYGAGSYFKPIKILPLAAGKALKARLKELTNEYNSRKNALHVEMLTLAKALLPEIK